MARKRSLSNNPMVRGMIRSGVRAGQSLATIEQNVQASFPGITPGTISRIHSQESTRQAAVDRIMAKDFRRRTNLHAIVGCGKGESIRARIVVQWRDSQTGDTRRYGQTLELRKTGVLGSILNEAIGSVLQDATGRGYKPPQVYSSDRTGSTTYRIEYVECV